MNGYDVYPRVMLDQGFTWHPKLTVNGRRLHGTEFCQELAALYRNGERILCEVGTQHVAAVLPGGKGDHISYQFWDSWNSSMSRDLIGDYYVKRPSGKSPGFGVERELQTGDTILHPSFGPGRLTGINDRGIWTVVFEKGVEKKLSGEWLRKNCSLAPEAGNSGVIG